MSAVSDLAAAGFTCDELWPGTYHVTGEGVALYVSDRDTETIAGLLTRGPAEPPPEAVAASQAAALATPTATVDELVAAITGAATFDDAKKAVAALDTTPA